MSLAIGAAVPSLTRWGLTSDADLVFRTLTTFGGHTPRLLARELGLPVRRVEDAIAELRTAGAVTTGAQGVWVGLPPDAVLVGLRDRRLRLVDRAAQINAHRRVIRSVAERLGAVGIPLATPAIGGLLNEHVRYLPTRALSRARLAELNVGRREQLTFNTEQVFDAESARAGSVLDRKVLDEGIRARAIGVPPADQDLYHPAEPADHRMQSRESPDVPMKMIMLDRSVAFILADPAEVERGYVEITQRAVVRELAGLFEQHWAIATDPRAAAVPPIVLSERERALIALLAQGHTDVTAAAVLRISARSVTNVLRALMDRVGVENRFQLGLALGSLGAAAPPVLTPPVPPAPIR